MQNFLKFPIWQETGVCTLLPAKQPWAWSRVTLFSCPIQSALLATSMESPWLSSRPAPKTPQNEDEAGDWSSSQGQDITLWRTFSWIIFLWDSQSVFSWEFLLFWVFSYKPVASGLCTPTPVLGPAVIISLYLCPAVPWEHFLNSLH